MKHISFIFIVLCTAAPHLQAQTLLDDYVKKGLDSNLLLKQKSFDVENAKLDLERAKTLFYPQVDFNSSYTLAMGGRTIDVPIGDLLNNAYKTLNQLTNSSKFPQVQNQSIRFLPNNFQDSKIEVGMPVYNPELKYNRAIKAEMINGSVAAINVYKRELVKTIKQAYYQYLQAEKAADIYTNALAVVNENLRVSEKLVKNTVATRDVILKSQAQVSEVQTSLAGAEEMKKNASAYFNFLLNLPFETPIEKDTAIFNSLDTKETVTDEVPTNREELAQIKSGQKALETNLKLNESYKLPKLNAFYDIGFQGYGYSIFNNQFYQLGGLQLTWNIFRGNDNKLKVKQTQIDIEQLQTQYDDVQKQLQLQVITTYNAYLTAVQTLQSAADETASTREAYRLTDKKYREGQALQIELIDARVEMTNAEIKYSLAQLAVLNKTAELERVTASYPLK
jgi:outer membrane protein TolC